MLLEVFYNPSQINLSLFDGSRTESEWNISKFRKNCKYIIGLSARKSLHKIFRKKQCTSILSVLVKECYVIFIKSELNSFLNAHLIEKDEVTFISIILD